MIKPFPPEMHRYYGDYPEAWRGVHPIQAFGFFTERRRVGGLCIFRAEIYHAGANLQAAGIGGVWVDEDHRGKKIASELVKYAVNWARKKEYALACLYAKKGGSLYTRAGFHAIRGLDDDQPLFVRELGPFGLCVDEGWKIWPEGKF